MLPLHGARLTRVREVEPGRLLHTWPESGIALRVDLPDEEDEERIGLLYILHPKHRFVVFNDASDIDCIDLGSAVFAWDAKPSSSSAAESAFAPGQLAIRPNDCALAAILSPGRRAVPTWWDVVTGKRVQSRSRQLLVQHWSVGVTGIDGTFLDLFSNQSAK